MDYQIISFDPTTGVSTFGIPAVPKVITGLDKLVQIVCLSFLRNPGKSVLAPNEGSGLRAAIGQYNSSQDGNEIRALAVQKVRTVQSEVITRQDPTQGTPDERLKSLVLKDFAYDSETSTAMLRVQIVAESGDSRDVLI